MQRHQEGSRWMLDGHDEDCDDNLVKATMMDAYLWLTRAVNNVYYQQINSSFYEAEHNDNGEDQENTGDGLSNSSSSLHGKNDENSDDYKGIQENNNEVDQVNTEDDNSNTSNTEDEEDNGSSSTTNLWGSHIQENTNEAWKINTEDDKTDASNGEDNDEVDYGNSFPTSHSGTDTEENEEDLSYSEENGLDAARSEGNVGSKDLGCSTSAQNTSDFSMDCEDGAGTGDAPLYPGAPLSKGERLLMRMSYLLRHNLTSKALNHLLEMFNIMFPGLIPSSHYLFHKEFGSSSEFEVHFYCESCLKYLGIRADCPSHCDSCSRVFDANANLKKGFYFLVLPLYAQIKQLLQEPGVSLNKKN